MILVAQIIGKALNGGVEACIWNYYKAIDKEKVQFHFFVENTSAIIDKEKIEKLGGKIIVTPKYTHIFKYIKFLIKTFKNNKYDIVHSNLNALSVFPLFAAKLAGIKVRIAHSHSTTNKKEFLRNLIKNFLKLFSKTFATDYFACSELAGRWLFGKKAFNSGKVFIVNNAIDLDKFKFDCEKRAEIRKLEPYCYGQFTEGKDSPHFGRSHVHWLTGTASTVMVGCVEGILGIRPDFYGLRISPAISRDWEQFIVEKDFRGKHLHIEVYNPGHKESGCTRLVVNGEQMEENYIPFEKMTDMTNVKLYIS